MTTTTRTTTTTRILKAGAPVHAFTLTWIAQTYGVAAAKAVDDASGPCPKCGHNTYGGVVCFGCDRQPTDEVDDPADDAGYGWMSVAAEGRDYGHDGGNDG